MMKKLLVGTAAVLTSAAMIASPTFAKDSDVTGAASCNNGVKAKIKAGPRDVNRIKTNVQIDDVGATSRAWTIKVTDGGATRTRTVTTAGASNSLDVDFFTADNSGADSVTFVATRVGARCAGEVEVPA
jgi:hypothetical protein